MIQILVPIYQIFKIWRHVYASNMYDCNGRKCLLLYKSPILFHKRKAHSICSPLETALNKYQLTIFEIYTLHSGFIELNPFFYYCHQAWRMFGMLLWKQSYHHLTKLSRKISILCRHEMATQASSWANDKDRYSKLSTWRRVSFSVQQS